jgi:hypothetical protein
MDALMTNQSAVPEFEPTNEAANLACRDHEVEAPDQGVLDEEREAPERRLSHHAEAPDAGEGRFTVLTQDFTHGRSQS